MVNENVIRRFSASLVMLTICTVLVLMSTSNLFGYEIAPDVRGKKNKTPQVTDKVPDKLLSKAKAKGSVRVIVEMNIPFSPEGRLAARQKVLEQRTKISKSQEKILKSVSGLKVDKVKRFKYIPYVAMRVDSKALSAIVKNPLVVRVDEDVAVPPSLTDSIPLINADDAWTSGYSGSGWTVAVLDTGVSKAHSFFPGGKVVAEACFSSGPVSLCPNGQTSQTGSGSGIDCDTSVYGCGHGTHVAGIAAGKSDTINGVAKDANIISVQVFSRFNSESDCGVGNAPCVLSYTSDQILGLEYVYSLRDTYNIASVNMSLGGGRKYSQCDSDNSSTKTAIDNLRSEGIATVIASGNSGYCDSMAAPGCISSAVSVGATTKSDVEASYNNYASFLSLFATGSSIYSSVPGGWGYKDGTSMATPHVSGAWAILKQKNPSASVDDILSAFQDTGVSIPNTCSGSGNYPQKRIDVLAALNYLAGDTTKPSIISFSVPTISTVRSPTEGFSISWDGSDNAGGSGIAGYQVQYRRHTTTNSWSVLKVDGNEWTTKKSTRFKGTKGYTYYFKIKAKDKSGNISGYSYKSAVVPYDETILNYSGSWKTTSYNSKQYLGYSKYSPSSTKGNYAQKKFSKGIKQIYVIATRRSNSGKIDIWLNGVKRTTVSLYSSSIQYRKPVWSKSVNVSNDYTIKIVATGTKSSLSSGTRADIDAIGIKR